MQTLGTIVTIIFITLIVLAILIPQMEHRRNKNK